MEGMSIDNFTVDAVTSTHMLHQCRNLKVLTTNSETWARMCLDEADKLSCPLSEKQAEARIDYRMRLRFLAQTLLAHDIVIRALDIKHQQLCLPYPECTSGAF
jgi:hypothetical protein